MSKTAKLDVPSAGGQLESELRLAPLGMPDIGAIHSLYQAVHDVAPHGHLADRAVAEFESILSREEETVSVGVWQGDTLVGYTLCSIHRGEPVFKDSPLIGLLQARSGELWTGKGTVIDPRFEGRMLMSRLLRMRGELIAKRGAVHTAGLVATTNLASLASSLRAGGWIVGMERDEYCDNFVCYSGALQVEFKPLETMTIPIHDLPEVSQKLAHGWVGDRMEKGQDGKPRQLLMFRHEFEWFAGSGDDSSA